MPRPPAVTCLSCGFAWYTATMADGLRKIGACPRCRGELAFAERAEPAPAPAEQAAGDERPPHLVLGLPRR